MSHLQFFFIMAGFGCVGYFLFQILDVLQQTLKKIERIERR